MTVVGIHIHTQSQTPPRLVCPDDCYRLQFLLAHFDHESLHHRVGSCKLLGYRLQHCTSSDIDGGVKVSVHELLAFLASGATHRCKDSSDACPLWYHSIATVLSSKHHSRPSPFLCSLVICSSLLGGRRDADFSLIFPRSRRWWSSSILDSQVYTLAHDFLFLQMDAL
jgi:hypothetical protein